MCDKIASTSVRPDVRLVGLLIFLGPRHFTTSTRFQLLDRRHVEVRGRAGTLQGLRSRLFWSWTWTRAQTWKTGLARVCESLRRAVGQSVACVARFYVAGRATVAGTIFGAGQLVLKNPRPFPSTKTEASRHRPVGDVSGALDTGGAILIQCSFAGDAAKSLLYLSAPPHGLRRK